MKKESISLSASQEDVKGPGTIHFISHNEIKVKKRDNDNNIHDRQNKKLKRMHAKKACLNCRKAHTACNDERPCTRCAKKKVPCIDPDPIDESSSNDSPTDDIRELNEKRNNDCLLGEIDFKTNQFIPYRKTNYKLSESNNSPQFREFQPNNHHQKYLIVQETQTATVPVRYSSTTQYYNDNNNNTQTERNTIVLTQNQIKQLEQAVAENQIMRTELERLRSSNAQQNMLLMQVLLQLQDLQAVTRKQQELLQAYAKSHLEQNISNRLQFEMTSLDNIPNESPQNKLIFPSYIGDETSQYPAWINLQNAGDNVAISIWRKSDFTMLGCNEAFCKQIQVSQERLASRRNTILDFKPVPTRPYIETILYALVNSSVKFCEVKAIFMTDSGKEIYVRDRLHIEAELFWACHEIVETLDDEYRFDDFYHPKSYDVPRDPTGKKTFMELNPANKKNATFMDILQLLATKKRDKPVTEYLEQTTKKK